MVVVLALIGCMGFCIYKKCFNKGKKPKKVRERKAGRGRRKKDKEGEDGEDKKVSLSKNNVKRKKMNLHFHVSKSLYGALEAPTRAPICLQCPPRQLILPVEFTYCQC